MKRIALAFAVLVFSATACSDPEPVAETAEPLYVDVTGGGHGPFACAGDVPLRGYADLQGSGACQRVRGDFAAIGYPGRVISGALIPAGLTTMTLSTSEPGHTYGYACKSAATGPASNPCAGQPINDISYFNNVSFAVNHFQWQPQAIVLGYDVPCPTSGVTWNHFQAGAGTQTPEDGSGLPTAVITDGFGHSLNAPNGTSLAGDCEVDVHTLQPNWYGYFVAVYTF